MHAERYSGMVDKWVQDKKRAEILPAFESATSPHLKALFRVAMYLERDRSKAEDLMQETFMQALQSFHRLKPGANCCVWLVAIMYNVKRQRHRKFSSLH